MLQNMIHDVHSTSLCKRNFMPSEQAENETSVISLLVDNIDNDLPDSCMIYDLHIAQDTPSGNTI
jgi:hypothetical protein